MQLYTFPNYKHVDDTYGTMNINQEIFLHNVDRNIRAISNEVE